MGILNLFVAACMLVASHAFAAQQPNIIWIMADDLGYGDIGCYGCKDIPTPYIDSIARDGVKFTSYYVYNVCSPTRAALLSGCYAEKNGVSKVLMGNNIETWGRVPTVAKALKSAGYVTGLIGKWHLGYTGDVRPTRMGFDEFHGFLGGKIDFFKHTDTAQKNGTPEGKHDFWEGETEINPEGYATDLFTERARTFIRAHKEKPFFLYLAYNAPHYSKQGLWQAPEAYLAKYNAVGAVKGRGVYSAMVHCMDDGIGRILSELKAQGLDEKTLVIFMSDNGTEGAGSNGPLSGAKHQNAEGGIRVPLVARFPGAIPAGSVRNDVMHAIDLAPTALAVANAEAPKDWTYDGINAWPAFTGKGELPERPIYFGATAMRLGRWKWLKGRLFDLDNDRAEKTDLAEKEPAVAERMKKLLQERSAALNAVDVR